MTSSPIPNWLGFEFVFARLIDRLVGLTDEEYSWQPVAGSWGIELTDDGRHRVHSLLPRPDPAPVTTIGWRICHIGDTLREERNWRWLDREPVLRDAYIDHPATAAGGTAYLREAYAAWAELVGSLADDELFEPLGPVAGPFSDDPKAAFVVHILDELIHHGAEVALLRDLYRNRATTTD